METGARRLLMKKSADNFSLGLFNHVFQCSKCRKYNTICKEKSNMNMNTPIFQSCLFCSNPNYVNRNRNIK